MVDWSELHHDLLVLVAKRFNLIEDYLVYATVCKSWRCVATKDNFNSDLPRAPWLMLAEEESDKTEDGCCYRKFFSLYNGMILKKRIPKAHGKRCMDSLGWLITLGKDEGEISLLHPFSGVQIELPHQNTTQDFTLHRLAEPCTYFQKAILSANPSNTSNYVLVVIEGNMRFLSYWRPGDLTWTRIRKQPSHTPHCDVVYFNGKFYTVDGRGRVAVYDFAGPDPIQTQIVAKLPSRYIADELYIVESLGSLLVIARDGGMSRGITNDSERLPLTRIQDDDAPEIISDDDYDEDDDDDANKETTYGTTDIRVFELDLGAGKLTETKELGDIALFIGHSASRSVQASQFPGIKPNHIYFTDDYFETYLSYEEGGGLDMGVYNLADGTIVPHYKGVSLSRVCPPTWVTPTLF